MSGLSLWESAAWRRTGTRARACTSTPRSARLSASPSTSSSSRPLAGNASPVGPLDPWLSNAHANSLDTELRVQRVGYRRGERLEQLVTLRIVDAANDVADQAVVDGRID